MIRETDSTHPNNELTGPSPLMILAKGAWGLPWPRKPVGKAKGKPGPRTTRSGVHKLGRKHMRMY